MVNTMFAICFIVIFIFVARLIGKKFDIYNDFTWITCIKYSCAIISWGCAVMLVYGVIYKFGVV